MTIMLTYFKQNVSSIIIIIFTFILYKWSINTIFTNHYLNFSTGVRKVSRNNHAYNLNQKTDLFSSVWCRGNNHIERICHFSNLCFDPQIKSFVFFHNTKSVLSGIPNDRFSPSLIDFSSVEDHNTLYFNYIDFPDAAISMYTNISYIKGHSLIFKRFNPENIMHIFHDDLLPIYFTLKELSFLSNQNEFLQNVFLTFADDRPPGPYSILYDNFLNRKPIFLSHLLSQQLLCFQDSYIGLNKFTTWYQYGFKTPQGPLVKNTNQIAPVILDFRDYFTKQFNLTIDRPQNFAVLLTREMNRKILNTDEVLKSIANTTGLETISVSLKKFTVLDIIQIVLCSRLIVGMHGSLLILAMFLNPYSTVVELYPYLVPANISTPYRTLITMNGLKLVYETWENKVESNSVTHPEYPPEFGGFYQMPEINQKEIKENSLLLPHLCCYNSKWLYRIYQDTIVDVDVLKDILNKTLVLSEMLKATTESSFEFSHLYPSEVLNIKCRISVENNKNLINISWSKPWNTEFMAPTIIEYEIWFQVEDTEEVKAFIMTRTNFIFEQPKTHLRYLVWIRCHVDGRIGPFNPNPLICYE